MLLLLKFLNHILPLHEFNREPLAGVEVFGFEHRILVQNFFPCRSGVQEFKYGLHRDSHTPDNGPPATDVGIDGNAVADVSCHISSGADRRQFPKCTNLRRCHSCSLQRGKFSYLVKKTLDSPVHIPENLENSLLLTKTAIPLKARFQDFKAYLLG